VNLAPLVHSNLNLPPDRDIATQEEGDAMEREMHAEQAFPALAENWLG